MHAHKKPKLVSPVPLQQHDHDEFYKKLYEVNPKSSILPLVPDYSDSFVLQKPSGSQTCLPPLPPLLSDVYRPEYLELRYDKLLQVCEEFYNSMEISPEQINNLEIATKEQSKTKLWFQYRAGRVTASKSKSATCTDPARPSISLIMSVCYPEAYKFTSSATRFK